jgi:arginyl-tRNA synthetase
LKHKLSSLFQQALAQLADGGVLPTGTPYSEIRLERSKDPKFGDFSCNAAMIFAKAARRPPRELAQLIMAELPVSSDIVKTEIAGPGFINVFLAPQAYYSVVDEILHHPERAGKTQTGAGQTVQIEFVSANPTGPLHVGHGRGAAYGGALSALLQAAGYSVQREYYVNDAGRQMDILAASVWLRYLELCGETIVFPSNGYKGDYVWDIAATLHRDNKDIYSYSVAEVFANIPADAPAGGDKEEHIDALIERCKHLLGPQAYRAVFDVGLNTILDDIRRDLREFGVEYEVWFSERGLTENGYVAESIARLKHTGHTYDQDGALWFRSTDFGDEKDRVLVRDNGQTTYFASDVAYHLNKVERGFSKLINIWGADHHGYVARVKAALTALGIDPARLTVLLVQFATLYRGGERQQMSTRSGEFVTLRELREDVGKDAARFFYVLRKSEQHMEFDLELAKSQSNDNPVYYVQYAHARISSVFAQAKERGLEWQHDAAHLPRLVETHETALLNRLARYPEIIESAALAHEPHQVAYYLRELAHEFHTYYNAHTFLVEDAALRNARLSLIKAAQQVLRNGLQLLGVSAPESM